MPNIINSTFFIRELELPNLGHTAEAERLTNFINKHEPECLRLILGYPLFKLVGVESSQRMTDLMNGAEYTDGLGELRKWKGLVHDTTISLIANYIFFYILQWKAQQVTGVGTAVSTPESGTSISPAEKMANAWNFFSEEVYEMSHFLWMKKDINGNRVYPEFSYHQYLESRRVSRKIDAYSPF